MNQVIGLLTLISMQEYEVKNINLFIYLLFFKVN